MTHVPEYQVASNALQIAFEQPYIPTSPGHRVQSGQVLLCAAACFAAAGLERRFGPGRRKQFENTVAQTGAKGVVYDAFKELEWGLASCTKKMEPNDAASITNRLVVMKVLVDAIKRPPDTDTDDRR